MHIEDILSMPDKCVQGFSVLIRRIYSQPFDLLFLDGNTPSSRLGTRHSTAFRLPWLIQHSLRSS